jgi:hypothetical protein
MTIVLAEGASLLKFITQGGVIGHVIVALSVVALALGAAQFATIRRTRMIPTTLLADVRREVAAGRLERAAALCRVCCRLARPSRRRVMPRPRDWSGARMRWR